MAFSLLVLPGAARPCGLRRPASRGLSVRRAAAPRPAPALGISAIHRPRAVKPAASGTPRPAAGSATPPAARWGASAPAPAPRGRVAVRAADAAPAPTNTFYVGIAWFFAHQVIGVCNDVIMKFMGANLGVANVVFLRFAFATLTMLPVMFAMENAFTTDRIPLHIARSVLLAAGIAGYVKGLSIAPIAVVTTLNFTIPLFTLALARIFLNEKVETLRWAATLVGFAGVMVVLQPGSMAFDPSWLIVLASAGCFAGLDVLNKKFVGQESFWAMIFYTALFTALISAGPAIASWVTPTLPQVGLLAMLGGGANLLLYCLLKSFAFVDASALAPFRYTELLLSATVGFLFFAEVPASTTLLGAAIIIPSTLFVMWQEGRAAKKE